MDDALTNAEREIIRRSVDGPTELERGAEIAGRCRETARKLVAERKSGRPESVAPSLVFAVIPGLPPSVNHTYAFGRKMVYKDAAAKQWQKIASLYLRRGRSGDAPYPGRVECRIILTTKTKRRMDCDNRIKAVQDCLAVAGVLLDDSQIWALNVTRREGSEETTTVEVIAIVDPDTSGNGATDRRGHADGDTGAGAGNTKRCRRYRHRLCA